MAAPELARFLGGEVFFAFISAVAFATILAVVAGLTISASTSFAHDFFTNVIHHGREAPTGRRSAGGADHGFRGRGGGDRDRDGARAEVNVAFLVGLAFAVAASANLPVIVFSIFWKRFNTTGAVCGMGVGLISSIVVIMVSPDFMAQPLFPLRNPGILSIPLGFLGAIVGTFLKREPEAEAKFDELSVRANTGLGR